MPLSFAAPWALAALAGLAAVWWLLRVHPPAPRRVRFPPVRILLGLEDREEPPHTTPWWLLLLRMALYAVIVLAVAGPRWDASPGLGGGGAVVVVVDDGWAAARGWEDTRASVLDILAAAEAAGRPAALAGTAPGTDRFAQRAAGPAAAALELARVMEPRPWPADRRAFLESLVGAGWGPDADVLWLWDGTDGGDPEAAALLARQLARLGRLRLMEGPAAERPLALLPPGRMDEGLRARARRLDAGPPVEAWVRASGADGRLLARAPLAFADGAREAEAALALPRELRASVARLEIEGQRHAAAAVLVDDRWRRRSVGLVTAGDDYAARPLLAPAYYLGRALEPFSDVARGSLERILAADPSVIALADVGTLRPEGRRAVEAWIEGGGTLVRFAGPRLAEAVDPLLPVPLRAGASRALGGALTWEEPQPLGAFPPGSPFAGLEAPADVLVRRQAVAEPSPAVEERTWAALADGTPLVTAEARGAGELVLFHVTANSDWSNLPLAGVFVGMLRRIVERSEGGDAGDAEEALPPVAVLDAFGREGRPGPDDAPLAPEALAAGAAGPGNPPGYYGHELFRRALNLGPAVAGHAAYAGEFPEGVRPGPRFGTAVRDLAPWLFALALALLAADTLVGHAVRGLLLPARTAAAVLAGAVLLGAPGGARAQGAAEGEAPAGALAVQLAYVRTGDPAIDETSRLGLAALGRTLALRTSVVPAAPAGVDVERDPLHFHPFLYWPVADAQPALSEAAAARLQEYLRTGGMVVFDTRDGSPLDRLDRRAEGDPRLLRILASLDLPRLIPAPPDHVLARAFYLLDSFPGRWAGGEVWIESTAGASRDEVFSVLAGSAGWAGAWAADAAGTPLHPVVPGGERQRELAYRFGINLAMYALTGNYKGDQVHAATILRRLQRRPDAR